MKKRIFKSFIFTFAVSALIILFVFSGSAKNVKKNGLTFDVQENGVTVVSYSGTAKKVKIPKKVNGVPVTAIGNECFWQARTITTLSIPSTVTEIGISAFNECTGLKKIVLPKELKSLGSAAFWYCTNLETVVLDTKAEKIGKDAFRGCDKVTVYAVSGTGAEKYLKKNKIKSGVTYPTSISVKSKIKMNPEKTRTLKIVVSPADTYYTALSVSTTNKAVADISKEGVVSSFGCGNAVITVSAKGNEKVFAKCRVKVFPAKPANLKQTEFTASSATISWTKSAGATEYKITRYDTAKKKWVALASTPKRTYTVANLKNGEEAKLRVRSIFKSGKTKVLGGIASITVAAKNNAPVTKLKQSSSTVDSVTVSWKAPSGAKKFTAVLLDKNNKQLSSTQTEKTSFTFSGLSYAAVYKARISAVYKNGNKTYNGKYTELSVKAMTPATVSGLKTSGITDSEVTVSWNKVSSASKYYIYIYNAEKKAFTLAGSTDKNSFTLTELDAETTVRIKICAVFAKTNKTDLIGSGAEISAKTAVRPIPKTKQEALSVFVKAFNGMSSQQNFSVFESRSLGNKAVLPDTEENRSLLSSLYGSKTADYNFVSGIETSKKLSLSSLLPTMNGKLSLSAEEQNNCDIEYAGDGNGFFITLTLPAAQADKSLASLFVSLPDWSVVAKAQSKTFSSVDYSKVTVSAKVNNGKLDILSVSVPFTAAGSGEDSAVFTVGGTLEYEYIFLWN